MKGTQASSLLIRFPCPESTVSSKLQQKLSCSCCQLSTRPAEASTRDVLGADRLKLWWRGFGQPRTYYQPRGADQITMVTRVIRSAHDAGCSRLIKLLEGFHQRQTQMEILAWMMLLRRSVVRHQRRGFTWCQLIYNTVGNNNTQWSVPWWVFYWRNSFSADLFLTKTLVCKNKHTRSSSCRRREKSSTKQNRHFSKGWSIYIYTLEKKKSKKQYQTLDFTYPSK